MKYNNFEKFVFRCPVLPVNSSFDHRNQEQIINEAIYLASPDLFAELKKEGRSINDKTLKKEFSSLKYQIRIRTRCTPFGLFAGCGIAEIGNSSEILLDGLKSYKSHTRLDMDFLCSLSYHISKLEPVKKELYYYPNSTLYRILNLYRFVEYKYVNEKREYNLSEITHDIYLAAILKVCKNGAKISGIIKYLKRNDIEEEEARAYIDTLIDNQVIVSNLEPHITGKDMLTGLIQFLETRNLIPEIKNNLVIIKNKLVQVDKLKIGRSENLYLDIEKDIQLLNIKYKKKFLFQSDVSIQPLSATISKQVVETAREGLTILNKLTIKKEVLSLSKFKEDFYKRYEDEEIPLVEALDPDIGVGFSKTIPGNIDFHPLIDHILKNETKEYAPPQISDIELLLIKKYYTHIEEKNKPIVLTDEDMAELPIDWDDLPISFSSIIEVIDDNNDPSTPSIIMRSAGGSSAANVLSRFCAINKGIKDHVKNIIRAENACIDKTKILAEIVHLPESRIGNILFRPVLRNYEIPYLAGESVSKKFKIPVTDLMISIKGGQKIRIRSKTLKREIIPRLTSAHNFASNSLPIYHFLCSFQAAEIRDSVGFTWGAHLSKKKHLPRVVFKNIILSPAIWNFTQEDFADIDPLKDKNFLKTVYNCFKRNKVNELVLLVKDDTKLLIDLSNDQSLGLLFSEIRNKDFVLEEFIFNHETPLIRSGKYAYRNEIIMGFYKSEK